MKRWPVFAYLLLLLTSGLLLAAAFPVRLFPWLSGWWLLLGYSLFLFLNLRYTALKLYHFKGLVLLTGSLLVIVLGAYRYLQCKQDLQSDYFPNYKPDCIKVCINTEPQIKNGVTIFKARVLEAFGKGHHYSCSGTLLVALKSNSSPALQYGDELLIRAKYKIVGSPANPFEFDSKAWLGGQNIYTRCFLQPRDWILKKRHQGNPLVEFALNLRQQQIQVYRKLLKNEEAFTIASTLILGYRSELSKETLDTYSRTGTIHVLSVSGMHVGLIYLVLHWMLKFMDRRKILKLFKSLLIVGLIWFYALLTGFSPCVLRSAIMISLFILSKTLQRQSNGLNVLAFSAFCLLFYDPFIFFDIGFQLSFLSVFGLMYLQPLIQAWLKSRHLLLRKGWALIAMSLAAQTATFPLSIYYFHQFPLYFMLSNLFIMLPASLLMYLGIVLLLLRMPFLATIFEWLICSSNLVLKWIAELPFSSLSGLSITKTELFLLCCGLALMVLGLEHYQKKTLFAALTVLIFLEISVATAKIDHYCQKKLVLFKLSKNYAAAYIKSDKATLFTDVDPKGIAFTYSIKPCLDQNQVTEIHFKFHYPDVKKIKHL